MVIVSKIGDYKGEMKMDKEKLMQAYVAQDHDKKNIFLEKLIFCQYADEHYFEDYFRIEGLEESELFSLISFLYHQDCFLMILEIMNKYKERFVSHYEVTLDRVIISEKFVSRLERMEKEKI